jgi:myosin-1
MAVPGGGFSLKISDSIEYAKKPGKMQVIKVVKDSQVEQDFYKSGAIHTKGGEPPNSVSRPLPKGKPIAAKPFTKGKLIKPGGPGGKPSKVSGTRNTKPVAQPNGGATQVRSMPAQPAAVSIPNHTRSQPSASSGRSVPPPPPPAPPVAAAPPRETQYRVLYDFNGQSANEITMAKDELVTILQKENNGQFMAMS